MAATGTPTLLGGGSGPAQALSKGHLVMMFATAAAGATYATGGNPVTLPAGAKGMKLRHLIVLNPIPDPAVDRIWSWNGSATTPVVVAKVVSTGAQVANAVATAETLALLFVFET